jgi:oxygen-independent coproporphyrinogen-3 oxidase
MVSVAFYFGFVDLTAFKARFGVEFLDTFEEEVRFVIKNKLMEIKDGRIYLTDRGADYINGVIPLFYSNRSKQELIDLSSKKVNREEDEKVFLSAYNEDYYKKPGVAIDCVIFRETNNAKEVLLIKRGEHPYMNCYALPGGFVKADETVKDAAFRELEEETNIRGINLSLVGVFSKPGRDPRGWIISIAYTGTLRDNQEIMSGSDSIDAIWVDINNLSKYGLAFDHADIIESAIKTK